MKKKITLVCIAKNEELYLQEWIDYHLKLGFDDIHIFQNDWRFNNLKKYPQVFFYEFDGKSFENYTNIDEPIWIKNIQAKCYTDFIETYHNDYEWAAFFDVDEFLVLKKHTNVKEFISNYHNSDCLIINWAMFGDSGLKTFDTNNPSVLNRFVMRDDKPHKQFKSICKLKPGVKHQIHWTTTSWTDTNYNVGDSPFNDSASFDVAQLNHYFTKTYTEFVDKVNRGNACHGKRNLSDFEENNFNKVLDTTAKDFFNNETEKNTLC